MLKLHPSSAKENSSWAKHKEYQKKIKKGASINTQCKKNEKGFSYPLSFYTEQKGGEIKSIKSNVGEKLFGREKRFYWLMGNQRDNISSDSAQTSWR